MSSNNSSTPTPDVDEQHISTSTSLDDEQRIKVLSPSMLVFRRFIRNKLAITGSIFIIFMFLFSFLGGALMPYKESQIFTEYVDMSKDFAGVAKNTDFRYTTVDGSGFPSIAQSQFVLSINNKDSTMSAQGIDYEIEKISDDAYEISKINTVATAMQVGKAYNVEATGSFSLNDAFEKAFTNAITSGAEEFVSNGVEYTVSRDKKSFTAGISGPTAVASMNVFDYAAEGDKGTYNFHYRAEEALGSLTGKSSGSAIFEADGLEYELKLEDGVATIYSISENNRVFADISKYIVRAMYPDLFLTLDFKSTVKEYINEGVTEFTYTEADGSTREYKIYRQNELWSVTWVEDTLVIMDYSSPSLKHPIGTDGNGMDLLTRIMYGGRISLLIGFIVVFIETFFGVILGGVAGYFGKWVDNLIMRIVDIFYCIPSTPLIIILGSIMDGLRVDPQMRMVYLMLVLGILGWPSIARMVRGQILSLREQEFMVAAEATGISSYRRIFKHLVPNVIPQLIVICTMSLGDVILTESVLSFLGLGVKFPFASWGNIINAVSNVHVMTSYVFVWVPAGLCILVTVLGFNFIGDGLRDAFDPKMKR